MNKHYKINTEKRVNKAIQIIVVFIGISVTWVSFRVNNTADIVWFYNNWWRNWSAITVADLDERWKSELIMLIVLFMYDFFEWRSPGYVHEKINSLSRPKKYAVYITFLLFLYCLLPIEYGKVFVYFQF